LEGLGCLASISCQHDRGKGPEILRVNANRKPQETSFGQYTQFSVFLPEFVLVFGNGLGVVVYPVKPSNDFSVFLPEFVLILLGVEAHCLKLSSELRVFFPAHLLIFGDCLSVQAHCVKPSNEFRVFLPEFRLIPGSCLGVDTQFLSDLFNNLIQFVKSGLDGFKCGPHKARAKPQRPDPSRGGHQE
jgi:hypothetical protein